MQSNPTKRHQAILAVLEGKELPSEAARNHGVSAKRLLQWLKDAHTPNHIRTRKLELAAQSLECRLDQLRREIDNISQQ